MHLTINQILKEINVFENAQLLAGEKGGDKIVTWTHISEHKDISHWIKQGTLLLSSGFLLKDKPELFEREIPSLIEKGLSGLVISVGSHIHYVPKFIIDKANENDFPIIAIPPHVPLMEVTHEIHKRIISSHYALIEQSFTINKILNKVVIDGGDLDDLVMNITNLINRSITIEDPDLRLLAHAEYGKSDELRNRTIQEGRTPLDVVAYLESSGILASIRNNPQPSKVPCAPDLGFIYERVVAPIMVGSQLYGYFWIIADESSLTEMDFIVIERGANIASLILSRTEAIYRAEQNIVSKLFDEITDPYNEDNSFELNKYMGFWGVVDKFQVMVIDHEQSEFVKVNRLYKLIAEICSREKSLIRLFEKGNRFVALLRGDEFLDNETLANNIVEEGISNGYNLSIGLGNITDQKTELSQQYLQAVEAIQIGKALSEGGRRVWLYRKIGSLLYFLNIPSCLRIKNEYYQLAESISRHDEEVGSDYFRTLEYFLDNTLNLKKTADKLFIHRNTLTQRINKIQEIWKMDLEDEYSVLNLHLAIKEFRIQKNINRKK